MSIRSLFDVALVLGVMTGWNARGTEQHFMADAAAEAVHSVFGTDHNASLKNGVNLPWSVAYDGIGNKLYWTNLADGTIRRANPDGTGAEKIIERPGAVFRGLVVDGVAGRLYFLDSESDTLNACTLDGANEMVLLADLRRPNDLALDRQSQMLYLTDSGLNRVIRCDTAGSKAEVVLSGAQADGVWGIAVSPEAGRLFLTSHTANRVVSARLDGSDWQQLVAGMETPRGLIVNRQRSRIYWVEAASNDLFSAEFDGSDVQRHVSIDGSGLRDLAGYESGDRDADLLPDAWEVAMRGGLQEDGDDDGDGDGAGNLREYLFGSSVEDPLSVPTVTITTFEHNGTNVIQLGYLERQGTWFTFWVEQASDLTLPAWSPLGTVIDSGLFDVDGDLGRRRITLDPETLTPPSVHFFRARAGL